MGASQSKTSEFDTGVEVTSGLLARLEGRPRNRPGLLPADSRPTREVSPATQEEVLKLIQRDHELRSAYEKSKLVGDLLLKSEREELTRVGEHADALLQREYRLQREPPCVPEHDGVLQCYTSHQADPLACADLVDAYVNCAHKARRGVR